MEYRTARYSILRHIHPLATRECHVASPLPQPAPDQAVRPLRRLLNHWSKPHFFPTSMSIIGSTQSDMHAIQEHKINKRQIPPVDCHYASPSGIDREVLFGTHPKYILYR
jgi:hypothetical protein